jgi:hypothetical protein
MTTLLADAFSGLLVFVFGSAAVAKLARQTLQVQTAEKLHIPWSRYRWIAVPEALAVLALLAGYEWSSFGAVAATGLAALMAGALTFRLRIRDSPGYLLGDAALLGIAAATAVLRVVSG